MTYLLLELQFHLDRCRLTADKFLAHVIWQFVPGHHFGGLKFDDAAVLASHLSLNHFAMFSAAAQLDKQDTRPDETRLHRIECPPQNNHRAIYPCQEEQKSFLHILTE